MTASPQAGNTRSRCQSAGFPVDCGAPPVVETRLAVEFSASGLRYAEAAPSLDGIRFSHISRVPLPEEALDQVSLATPQ